MIIRVRGNKQLAIEYDFNAKTAGTNFTPLSAKEVALSVSGSTHPFLEHF
jgi:hypothetical protein